MFTLDYVSHTCLRFVLSAELWQKLYSCKQAFIQLFCHILKKYKGIGPSASEMTYIVSGGALNSTHSFTRVSVHSSKLLTVWQVDYLGLGSVFDCHESTRTTTVVIANFPSKWLYCIGSGVKLNSLFCDLPAMTVWRVNCFLDGATVDPLTKFSRVSGPPWSPMRPAIANSIVIIIIGAVIAACGSQRRAQYQFALKVSVQFDSVLSSGWSADNGSRNCLSAATLQFRAHPLTVSSPFYYDLKSHKYVCITTYPADTNPNRTTKQHAVVNTQLNIVTCLTNLDKLIRGMLLHRLCDFTL